MPSKKIAIVDAGIGGLGAYNALKAKINVPTLYFSDSGYIPYGKVPTQQLKARLAQVFSFLYAQGADKIIVACNAASCALPDDHHVEGIIRHGINAVKHANLKDVGLIAGARTVRSQSYARPLRAAGFTLTQRIAQPLSKHIESGVLDGAKLHQDLQKILSPLQNKQALVLACTHYPAIKRQIIKHINKDTLIIDPAEYMIDWICNNWSLSENIKQDSWFSTGDINAFIQNAKLAFDVTIPCVKHVSL